MAAKLQSPYPDALGFVSVHVPKDNSQYLIKIEREEDYPYSFRLRGTGIVPDERSTHLFEIETKTVKTPALVRRVNRIPANWTPFKEGRHYAVLTLRSDGRPYRALIRESNYDPDNFIVNVADSDGNVLQFTFVKMHANPFWFIVGVIVGIILAVTAVGLYGMLKTLKECIPSSTSIEISVGLDGGGGREGGGGGDGGGLIDFSFEQSYHCVTCVEDHYGGAQG